MMHVPLLVSLAKEHVLQSLSAICWWLKHDGRFSAKVKTGAAKKSLRRFSVAFCNSLLTEGMESQ